MTDERLTPERFRELADAYGAVIARWPQDVRAAAMRMAEEPGLSTALAAAARLDATLDRWAVRAPGTEVRERVLRSVAYRPRSWRRAKLWWSGIGIATALAGAAAGSVAAAAVAPADPPAENLTVFGDLGSQEA